MSKKTNTAQGGKKAKNYGSKGGSKGGGMRRHALSGHAHNHANSIARVREYNKEQERLASLRHKPPMYSSVQEVFKNK